VLEQLCGQIPLFSKARYSIRSFGIRRNEKIACYVTVRGGSGVWEAVHKQTLVRRGAESKDQEGARV